MKKKIFISLFILIAFVGIIRGQLVLGQYEDEAPFRTWNIFGVYNARASAMGESIFGMVNAPFFHFLNSNQNFSFSLNFSYNNAEFFKYSFINTGEIFYSKNLKTSFIGLDFARGSLKLRDWIFTLSFAQLETYFRPGVEVDYTYRGETYRKIKGSFEGYLNSINFSVCRKISKLVSFGIGVHYVYGEIKREVEDDYSYYNVLTTDHRIQELKGYYFTLGLLTEVNPELKIIAFVRTPYVRHSKSESELRYYSQKTQIEIQINGNEEDKIKIPFKAGVGILYQLNENLCFTSNIIFFNWTNYEVEYFGEKRKRDFKNTLKFGAGAEYLYNLKIKENLVFTIPFRIGYIYDSQPMKNPDSYYNYFTAGMGIHFKKYFLDLGFMFGKETGSGNSLHASKIICTLSFEL